MRGLAGRLRNTRFYFFMANEGVAIELTLTAILGIIEGSMAVSAYASWYEVVKNTDFFWWAALIYLVAASAAHAVKEMCILAYYLSFRVPSYDSSSLATVTAVQSLRITQSLCFLSNVCLVILWYWSEDMADMIAGAALPSLRPDDALVTPLRVLLGVVLNSSACVFFTLYSIYHYAVTNESAVHNISNGMSNRAPAAIRGDSRKDA